MLEDIGHDLQQEGVEVDLDHLAIDEAGCDIPVWKAVGVGEDVVEVVHVRGGKGTSFSGDVDIW